MIKNSSPENKSKRMPTPTEITGYVTKHAPEIAMLIATILTLTNSMDPEPVVVAWQAFAGYQR